MSALRCVSCGFVTDASEFEGWDDTEYLVCPFCRNEGSEDGGDFEETESESQDD